MVFRVDFSTAQNDPVQVVMQDLEQIWTSALPLMQSKMPSYNVAMSKKLMLATLLRVHAFTVSNCSLIQVVVASSS
jgi:hypothetical protein